MPTQIRKIFPASLLPSAVDTGRKAEPEDAGTATGSHSEVVRGISKAGNDTRPLYGLWHYAKPYRYKRFANDDAAWLWARTHGYRYDGRMK